MLLNKKEIRAKMKEQRTSLAADEKRFWDYQIYENILALDMVGKSRTVYCYLSFGSEIDTFRLVRTLLGRSQTVAVPRVAEGEIRFFQIRDWSECRPGYRGIYEPMDDCLPVNDPAAPVIVPGLAFTERGDRLGYGGGYYDRFLSAETEHPTLALAYPFQVLDWLPAEEDDRRVDWILTPERLIKTRRE